MFYIKRTWDPVLEAKKKIKLGDDLESNEKLEKDFKSSKDLWST